MRSPLLAALLLLAVRPALAAATASARLAELMKSDWERQLREDPLNASDLGDKRFNSLWPDLSREGIDRAHREDEQALAELAKIDRAALSGEDVVDYDLFKWQHEDKLDSYRFREYLFPLNQMGGIQTVGDMATQTLSFSTVKDYEDWLARMKAFPVYMNQTLELLREGVQEGRTLPRVVAQRIPKQIDDDVVANAEDSTFYAPFKKFPSSIDKKTADRLAQEARDAITLDVVPSYRRLKDYFEGQYLPHCRKTLAARDLPDGKAYYAYLARHYTTTDLSPRAIHELGLKKVAEIRGQMRDAIKETGFKGGFSEFLTYLRTSPRFYYTDPADLLEAYRAQGKEIDPKLVKWFGKEPRAPWGIEPIPADQAPNTYTAYADGPAADGSRAAIMSVNLYKPETRPKYEIPALTCHEGRPGHSLQLALAAELTDLPEFRRFGYYNAYGEGWAVYCETLCGEMGVYDTPYKRFGMLSYQMWRALRLVVDTGIHDQGMTREQAVKLFQENTAMSQQNIDAEVDRYIAWPGQALSYMIGELEIQKLRAGAQKKLGPKFDIRGFHDAVLSEGTLPLKVLDSVVERWVAEQGNR